MDISKIAEKVAEFLLPKLGQMDQSVQRLDGRVEEISKRLTDINNHQIVIEQRIDDMREELTVRIDRLSERIDGTNKRLDRLYEVVVKREEHVEVLTRISKLEGDVELLKRKIAV